MGVVLRPMTEDTYRTYLPEHEEEYARDRMITDQESFEDALRTTAPSTRRFCLMALALQATTFIRS